MPGRQTIPWPEIHELLLAMGAVREPRASCVRAVRELARLVPYDQARLYFVDAAGRTEDEELLGAAWGSETPIRSRGGPVVLVDEPAEQVVGVRNPDSRSDPSVRSTDVVPPLPRRPHSRPSPRKRWTA